MIAFEEQRAILRSGAAEVIPGAEFDRRLKEAVDTGRPLRVKLGLDPTAAHVHLGWTVVLRKLRQFQDLGHRAVLIIGDFTAQVGDPSGKSETRKPLTAEAVREFAFALLDQFRHVLDMGPLEIRWNSEWLAGMNMADVLRLTSHYTVARMLERDDFAKRYASARPISLVEFLYPLMQGYDSVAVEADVELGGTDQTFNLLVGRDLQERLPGGPRRPQVVLTMPLLEGTDGVQKMSQSLGNYIGITEAPEEMFGKVMRVPDTLMVKYCRLVTDLSLAEVSAIEAGLADATLHPAAAKRRLAWELVRMYQGAAAADGARDFFDRVHRDRQAPEAEAMAEFSAGELAAPDGTVWLPALLVAAGMAKSNGEGRRLIAQGGVRVDGVAASVEQLPVSAVKGRILQVGRRNFVRLI